MNVGKIRAVNATFDTGGGTLVGTVTAGEVRINTAGGRLELKRLVGTDVEVLAGGGAHVAVCYCDSVSIDSGGAHVSVGHMNCGGPSVVVQSHGGRIAVNGLDGVASLQSQGGAIDVQITEKAQEVQLLSGGGDVSVHLAPGLAAHFEVYGQGGVSTRGVHLDVERQDSGTLRAFKPAETPANHAGSAKSVSTAAQIVIDAGSGAVTIAKRSWQSAITEKMLTSRQGGVTKE